MKKLRLCQKQAKVSPLVKVKQWRFALGVKKLLRDFRY